MAMRHQLEVHAPGIEKSDLLPGTGQGLHSRVAQAVPPPARRTSMRRTAQRALSVALALASLNCGRSCAAKKKVEISLDDPPAPTDVLDLVKKDVAAEQRGEICPECWLAQSEGHKALGEMKNVVSYDTASIYTCKQQSKATSSLLIVEVKAKVPDGSGGNKKAHYLAVALNTKGHWRLLDFLEQKQKDFDWCKTPLAVSVFERYPEAALARP